jgi:hypothetical protein
MAKAPKKAPPKKPRAGTYDEKLAIKGKFAEVKVIKKNKEDKKKPAPNDLEDYQELDERELGGEG